MKANGEHWGWDQNRAPENLIRRVKGFEHYSNSVFSLDTPEKQNQ